MWACEGEYLKGGQSQHFPPRRIGDTGKGGGIYGLEIVGPGHVGL
jgi:hypothetical protein